MKNIAVFTSGGDSPGMNACIRAVVRTGIYNKLNMFGIYRGYQGMIEGDITPLDSKSVGNILQRGGTILKSSRSEAFRTKEGRSEAYKQLQKYQIDGVVAIGGDGTFTGAGIFNEEYHIPFIGLPGTIDNDLVGTDFSIGYDTAINTVVSVVDKIRDTADSHNRLFIVEVMGKDAGFIALRSGIGSGAEAILVPETATYIDSVIEKLEKGRRKNKASGIIIVAEGDDSGGANEVAQQIKNKFEYYDIRVSILGHMQRGGSPTAMDRVLASKLGFESVQALLNGRSNEMIGMVNKKVTFTPFKKAIKHHTEVKNELLHLVDVLSI